MRILRFTTLAIVLLMLAGCGEQAASSSPASAPADPSPSVAESAEPSSSPTAEESNDEPGSSAAARLECADLEEMLPAEIGDATITVTCLTGEQIVQLGQPGTAEQLEDSGVDLEDAAIAIGSGSDGTTGMFVYSIPGADVESFRDNIAEAMLGQLGAGFESGTVGGKSVLVAEAGEGLPADNYLYIADGLMVWLFAADEADAAEVLADLP